MKKTELRKAMNEYQQIAAQIAQLEKQKAAVADRIKAHMDAAGVDEMQVDDATDRKSTRLNSSHKDASRMPSSA